MNYLICAHRGWSKRLFEERISKLDGTFVIVSSVDELNKMIHRLAPNIVFFLDWSWIVPKEITDKYNCIGFHSAPLPEFRGGSPIQNQIIRGVERTKITAFRMDGGIDTGNILKQMDLDLSGHIRDILDRIANSIYLMIKDILDNNFIETKQTGSGSYYGRRKPKESEITKELMSADLTGVYNFIRMLEDPYPNAFLDLGDKRIIFKSAEKSGEKIFAEIEIIKKEQEQ